VLRARSIHLEAAIFGAMTIDHFLVVTQLQIVSGPSRRLRRS
jgi:hypothetical protein